MRAELCVPFIRSLNDTFTTMLDCEVRHTSSAQLDAAHQYLDISGVISFGGGANGICVLSLSREVALKAASAILMMDATDLDADVIDAVGELTNIVAGGAKSQLDQYQIRIGLPTVVTGNNHQVNFPSQIVPMSLDFTSPWGPLSITVGLLPIVEPQPVEVY